jgi:branched chain amino acid efflux pump
VDSGEEQAPTEPKNVTGGMRGDVREVLATAAPLAAAIGVFGTIYGAAARAVAGPAEIILSSLLIFSGAVQFASVGLLLERAAPIAVLMTAAMLNARNLVLGAALRPRIRASRARRAFLGWWLLDETAGLALASKESVERVLLLAGIFCYSTWVVGTTLGVLGASLVSLEGLAEAVFPVLFVGLAALSAVDRAGALRAGIAAVATLLLVIVVPSMRDVAPVLAALVVSFPEARP